MSREISKGLEPVRVAVVISDGFEQAQFDGPVWELKKMGAVVEVLSHVDAQRTDGIRGLNHIEPAQRVMPDRMITDASPDSYDGLLIPGGAISVDALRESTYARALARNLLEAGRPVAVIGHGAWLLADAGLLAGYTLTSWPAIRKDLERAGAIWKEQDLVQDRNLITVQKTDQCGKLSEVFNRELVQRARPARRSA